MSQKRQAPLLCSDVKSWVDLASSLAWFEQKRHEAERDARIAQELEARKRDEAERDARIAQELDARKRDEAERDARIAQELEARKRDEAKRDARNAQELEARKRDEAERDARIAQELTARKREEAERAFEDDMRRRVAVDRLEMQHKMSCINLQLLPNCSGNSVLLIMMITKNIIQLHLELNRQSNLYLSGMKVTVTLLSVLLNVFAEVNGWPGNKYVTIMQQHFLRMRAQFS